MLHDGFLSSQLILWSGYFSEPILQTSELIRSVPTKVSSPFMIIKFNILIFYQKHTLVQAFHICLLKAYTLNCLDLYFQLFVFSPELVNFGSLIKATGLSLTKQRSLPFLCLVSTAFFKTSISIKIWLFERKYKNFHIVCFIVE